MQYKQSIWSLFDKIYEVMAIKINHDPMSYLSQLKLTSPQLKNMYYPMGYMNQSPYSNIEMDMQYQMQSNLSSISLNLPFTGTRGSQITLSDSSNYDSSNLNGDIQNIMKEKIDKLKQIPKLNRLQERMRSFSSTCKSTSNSHQENIPNSSETV
jgi:hypothetical protein